MKQTKKLFNIRLDKNAYKPLDEVQAECQWQFPSKVPYSIEVMLVYYSIQKKSPKPQKEILVQKHIIWGASAKNSENIIFQLPDYPYSFEGKIFDIKYAIKIKYDKHEFYENLTCAP